MSAARDHVATARVLASKLRPYLTGAAMTLRLIEVDGLMATRGCPGPIAVDKWWRCYYDPAEIVKLAPLPLATVVMHEAWHLLKMHPLRAEQLRAQLRAWNVCADAEINGNLAKDADLALPAWTVTPAKYGWPDGLLAEDYYRRLESQASQQAGGAAQCGSCAHGESQAWEEGAPTAESPGLTEYEAQAVREQTAKAVKEYKARGTMPAWAERWANDILHVKVDPERLFRGLVRRACATAQGVVDYSYAAPSRRQAACPNLVLPTMRRPEIRPLVIVDTSGSMGADDLGLALGLVQRVLQSLGHRTPLPVMSCDAAASAARQVASVSQIKLIGGGGTDMGAGLAAVAMLRRPPDLVVVVTDGETPWPPAEPPFPVVVAFTRPGKDVPAWARSVVLREDAA